MCRPHSCTFIEKETSIQVFPCELCEVFRNTFFYKTILVVASSFRQTRSSHQRCSMKIGALRNFAKFTGKHLCQSLRPATLLKKRLWYRCFPVNFAKFSRTPFLQNTSGWLLSANMKMNHSGFWLSTFQNFKAKKKSCCELLPLLNICIMETHLKECFDEKLSIFWRNENMKN